jgi:hypothetical protein
MYPDSQYDCLSIRNIQIFRKPLKSDLLELSDLDARRQRSPTTTFTENNNEVECLMPCIKHSFFVNATKSGQSQRASRAIGQAFPAALNKGDLGWPCTFSPFVKVIEYKKARIRLHGRSRGTGGL